MSHTSSDMTSKLTMLSELLLMFVFATILPVRPLYTSNQNTYFLHGLANADIGYLRADWLAQTSDPFPFFSFLVWVTVAALGEEVFYLYQVLANFVYLFSLVRLGSHVFGLKVFNSNWIIYALSMVLFHSGAVAGILDNSEDLQLIKPYLSYNGFLARGVAGQYVLGAFFQPSTFGVLLILSIYLFASGRLTLPVVLAGLSVLAHSAYIISATTIVAVYTLIHLHRERSVARASTVLCVYAILVTPVLIYSYVTFAPTSAEVFEQSQRILVDFRMPHHAIVARWFGVPVVVQVSVVLIAIYLSRGTRAAPVLLALLLVGSSLSIIQVLSGNKSLALLFPWRVSVLLVPIASSIVLAGVVTVVFNLLGRWACAGRSSPSKILNFGLNVQLFRAAFAPYLVAFIVALPIAYLGVRNLAVTLNSPRVGVSALTEFAYITYRPGHLFMIPPELEWFRLAAKVPILVDFKSHPYKDIEVVEWFKRLRAAQEFYASEGNLACILLERIALKYGVTHVVTQSQIEGCKLARELYRDAYFSIYEVALSP